MEGLRRHTAISEVELGPEHPFSPVRESPALIADLPASRGLSTLEVIWERRRLVYWVALHALLISTAVAFLIPRQFESTVSIMPPKDGMGDNGLMLAALAGKGSPGLGAMAGNILGAKSTGALFVDLLRSRTVQDRMVSGIDRSAARLLDALQAGCPQDPQRPHRRHRGPKEWGDFRDRRARAAHNAPAMSPRDMSKNWTAWSRK